MPLPSAKQFVGPDVSEQDFKSAQTQLINYLNLEVPTNEQVQKDLSNKVNLDYVESQSLTFGTTAELKLAKPKVGQKAKTLDSGKVWEWKGTAGWVDTGEGELERANENIIKAAETSIQTDSDLYDPDDQRSFEVKQGEKTVLSVEQGRTIGEFYSNQGDKLNAGARAVADLYTPNSQSENGLQIRDGNAILATIKYIDAAEVKYDLFAPNQLKTELKDGDEVLATFPIELPELQPQLQIEPTSKAYFFNAGGTVRYINDFGEYEIETAHVIESFIPNSECSAIAVAVNDWFHKGKSLNVFGVNGCLYPNPLKILVIVPSYGQSLNVASKGVPGISLENPQPDYALMFDGVNVRLDSSGNAGKTPLTDFSKVTDFGPIRVIHDSTDPKDDLAKEILCIPFAQKIADTLFSENGVPMRVLSFAAGVGGTPLDYDDFPNSDGSGLGLKKGSNAYTNLIGAISKAKEVAAKKGWVVVVPSLLWQHGEGDAGNKNYAIRLNQLIADVNADVKLITGQTQDVVFHASLKSNHNGSGTTGLEQSLDVARTNRLFKITSTNYPAQPAIWDNDFTHLSARGYNYLGFMYAKAFYQELKNQFGTFKALTFESAIKDASIIDVTLNVPVAPIRYATNDVVLAHESWGFRFTDDGVEIPILSVRITGDNTLRLTLESEPSTSNQVLSAAMYGHTSSERKLETIARTNICDSDFSFGDTAGGDSTQNWLIPFKYQF